VPSILPGSKLMAVLTEEEGEEEIVMPSPLLVPSAARLSQEEAISVCACVSGP